MIKDFFVDNLGHIIGTLILIAIVPMVRFVLKNIVIQYSKFNAFNVLRTKMVLRYIYGFLNFAAVIMFIVIWGVDTSNMLVTLSSVFAVIGVALFAQWSVLSNITSGIILFFSTPMKIGDTIKIQDKDFPVEAQIEDIKVFYIHLRTAEGEKIIYPNNLLLQKGIRISQTLPDEEDL